jgi:hypothetical protein
MRFMTGWLCREEINMTNVTPTFKDPAHAFEIALTAADADDWQLCRQALEFFFKDAPIGTEPDTPPPDNFMEGALIWCKLLTHTGMSHIYEILGAPTEWAKRSKQTYEDIKAGDTPRAVEDFPLMPTFTRNILKAVRLKERGLEKRSGQPVIDDDFEKIRLSFGEAARQATGFRPPKLSEHYRRGQSERLVERYWQDKKSDIIKRWAIARNRFGDYSKQAYAIQSELDRFNYDAPDYIPPVTGADLRRRAVPRRSKRKILLREEVK